MKPALCLFICLLIASGAMSCKPSNEQAHHEDADGITLDADVPGTDVYLADKKLGSVPVTLSAAELKRLGLPNPRDDTNAVLNSDGFGETVFVSVSEKEPARFMFLVPERVRSDYISLETPWGIRTRHAGGTLDPQKSVRVDCAKIIRRDGLSLRLEGLNASSSGKRSWNLRITLSNHGSQAIRGFRPSIMICNSSFGSRSKQLAPSEVKLRDEWASISPGKSRQVEISIEPPEDKGDYGLYVVFSLFKDATSDHLAGDGWCYSNTKLFSVK